LEKNKKTDHPGEHQLKRKIKEKQWIARAIYQGKNARAQAGQGKSQV
jgi:hypothetical protein